VGEEHVTGTVGFQLLYNFSRACVEYVGESFAFADKIAGSVNPQEKTACFRKDGMKFAFAEEQRFRSGARLFFKREALPVHKPKYRIYGDFRAVYIYAVCLAGI
jgi:hypothetical protein